LFSASNSSKLVDMKFTVIIGLLVIAACSSGMQSQTGTSSHIFDPTDSTKS